MTVGRGWWRVHGEETVDSKGGGERTTEERQAGVGVGGCEAMTRATPK